MKAYTTQPPLQPVPRDEHGPLIINHTGKTFGHFEVVGYYGFAVREEMDSGRELADSERDLWVVQCSCGLYYLYSHDYLRRQLRKQRQETIMCITCLKKHKEGTK